MKTPNDLTRWFEREHGAVQDDAERMAALAHHLDLSDPDDLEEIALEDSGDDSWDVQGGEYLVLTDDEANDRVREYIEESVWAFNSWFLACYVPDGIDASDIDSLRGDRCEDANPGLVALIEAGDGMDAFVEGAIAADGWGHFLSSYDGHEDEIAFTRDEGATEYLYVFRVN